VSQTVILKARGIITSTNQLSPSDTPEGALSVATNVVIDSDSVIQSRRGFQRLASTFAGVDARVDRLTSYQGVVIGHRSNDNKLAAFNGSTWTDFAGTFAHADADLARMRFAGMNGNLYFTTSEGIQVLDDQAGPVYATGMPAGLDGTATITGATGFMTNDSQVAYRILWGSRDAGSNLYLGAPSQRILVANPAATGGTRNTSLTFSIPAGITTADFYQVYRSNLSATATSEPNDELQLVGEANPTSAQITARAITVTDSTPDSLKGAFLYTNANQETISEENDIPPFAKDIATFKNYMFYAGIKTKHSINIKLLAVGGSAGLALNDTITIDGLVFTAKATETIANREFALATAGSPAQNIDDTARSLVRVINQYLSNTTVYAYYTTGYTELPGQIFIQKRSIQAGSFTVVPSRTTSWDVDTGTSANQDFPHGLAWSKPQQPEHAPAAHLQFVGDKAFPIRRILALRESLFILKDDGIWRLTGVNGSWRIDSIDTSTKILAPDSAVVLNNLVVCLSDLGVVQISDIGVQIQSRAIKDKLDNLMGASLDNLKKQSFGISYETEGKYILYTVATSADTFPTQAFVYNTFTNTWTMWDKPALSGFINKADGLLYISQPDTNQVLKERKSSTFRDYVDEEIEGYSITAFSQYKVSLNTVSGLTVGDLLYLTSSIYSPITAIDTSSNSVTVSDVRLWTVGAVKVNKAITCTIEWANQTFGNPGVDKLFQETTVLFKSQSFISSQIGFYTDMSGGYAYSTLMGSFGYGAWGLSPWGSDLWGGISRPKPLRVFVPREKSRGSLLSIRFVNRQAYSSFALQGASFQFEFVSERLNRS
jgi:hypothetical protein